MSPKQSKYAVFSFVIWPPHFQQIWLFDYLNVNILEVSTPSPKWMLSVANLQCLLTTTKNPFYSSCHIILMRRAPLAMLLQVWFWKKESIKILIKVIKFILILVLHQGFIVGRMEIHSLLKQCLHLFKTIALVGNLSHFMLIPIQRRSYFGFCCLLWMRMMLGWWNVMMMRLAQQHKVSCVQRRVTANIFPD